MKKVYEKARVFIEKFELSAHIASQCVLNYVNSTEGSCHAAGELEGLGNVQVFQTGVDGCVYVEDNGTFCNLVQEDHTAVHIS